MGGRKSNRQIAYEKKKNKAEKIRKESKELKILRIQNPKGTFYNNDNGINSSFRSKENYNNSNNGGGSIINNNSNGNNIKKNKLNSNRSELKKNKKEEEELDELRRIWTQQRLFHARHSPN
jgi:hypothetical protein